LEASIKSGIFNAYFKENTRKVLNVVVEIVKIFYYVDINYVHIFLDYSDVMLCV